MSIVFAAIPFALPFALFGILGFASHYGGWIIFIPFWLWVTLGDAAAGRRTANLDAATPGRRLWSYRLLTWLWAPLQIGACVYVFWHVHIVGQLALWEIIALVLVLGKTCASGINVAHELIHRPSAWERALGELLLSSCALSCFRTEHVYIHHTHVGTPNDPVFAPKGTSLWRYLLWSVFGNVHAAWRFERDRLVGAGVSAWHPANPFWRYVLATAAWVALFGWMGGWFGIGLYFLYSLTAVALLRIVDYVEHYGLARRLLPNGRFEPVAPRHSWSAGHRFSNWAAFNLLRHPDHHQEANRPYPLLQHHGEDSAPQLPYNYVIMVLLALLPRLWFKIMDPRVDAWRQRFYAETEPAAWRSYESRAYRKEPRKLAVISEIMESSNRLGRWMQTNPTLLASLEDADFANLQVPDDIGLDAESLKIARRGLVRLFYAREFELDRLKPDIMASVSVHLLRDVVDEARAWTNARAFQIAMHTLRGNLQPRQAQATFADMIDASLDAVVDAAAVDFADSFGTPRGTRLAVVACGDLGTRDVQPEGRVEFLYMYDEQSEAAAATADSDVPPATYYDRLSTRCAKATSVLARRNMLIGGTGAPGGALGEVNGASFSTLLDRLQGAATFADCAALAHARVVRGDAATERNFRAVKRKVFAAAGERLDFASELAAARARLADAFRTAVVPPQQDARGGPLDLTLVAAYLKIVHGPSDDGVLDADTPAVFERLAENDRIDAAAASDLAAASRLWRDVDVAWQLTVRDESQDGDISGAMRRSICLATEQESMESLAAHARATAERAVGGIDSLLATVA